MVDVRTDSLAVCMRFISVLRSLLAWLHPCLRLPTCWFENMAVYMLVPCCFHAGYNHRLLPFAESVRRPPWTCTYDAMVLHFGIGCPFVARSLLFLPIYVPTRNPERSSERVVETETCCPVGEQHGSVNGKRTRKDGSNRRWNKGWLE